MVTRGSPILGNLQVASVLNLESEPFLKYLVLFALLFEDTVQLAPGIWSECVNMHVNPFQMNGYTQIVAPNVCVCMYICFLNIYIYVCVCVRVHIIGTYIDTYNSVCYCLMRMCTSIFFVYCWNFRYLASSVICFHYICSLLVNRNAQFIDQVLFQLL